VGVVQVLTDEAIRAKLGMDGLAEVQANLWLGDCQSCGQPLGADPPALCVDDMMLYAAASLHHVSCQAPRWRSEGRPRLARRATAVSRLLLLSAVGGMSAVPVMLVNPSLEAVLVAVVDRRWRVNTVGAYGRVGLGSVAGVNGARVLPKATAVLRDGVLVVQLTEKAQVERWSCSVDKPAAARAAELGRVMIGVTTAVRPDEVGARVDVVVGALESGHVAVGWIELADPAAGD
jgi:hypothetical protein